MPKRNHVLIIHNIVSPYRLPVFDAIAEHVDATIWFCRTRTANRLWDTSLDGYTFKRRILPSYLVGPFFLNPTIVWRLMRERFDTYIVGDFPEAVLTTFAVALTAKLRRKPLIIWNETTHNEIHSFQHLDRSGWSIYRPLLALGRGVMSTYRRLLFSLGDEYIALSRAAANFLKHTYHVDPELISQGFQVIPVSQLPEPDIEKNDSPYAGTRVVLYLGYLYQRKGLADLVTAFRRLPDPDLRLVIAGTGPDGERLKALSSGDSRISFPGYADGVAKANLYTWSDVFVLPTLIDVWGLVINEALHYQRPVITTTEAAGGELIKSPADGRIIPVSDPEALYVALRDVLAANLKPAYRPEITSADNGAAPIIAAVRAVEARS